MKKMNIFIKYLCLSIKIKEKGGDKYLMAGKYFNQR